MLARRGAHCSRRQRVASEQNLNGNAIGDAGVAALLGAIAGGALGRLEELYIDSPSAELRAAGEGRGITVFG